MPRRSPSTRRSAATARKKTCWTACKPAPICTSTSMCTPTRPSSTNCSPRASKSNRLFEEMTMPDAQLQPSAFRPKKSVALSGVTAGNTALCTVGTTGNDLHYRGYDILDIAGSCEFEEIAYLLVHEKLPTQTELTAYKTKLKALRGLPGPVRSALELLPAASH